MGAGLPAKRAQSRVQPRRHGLGAIGLALAFATGAGLASLGPLGRPFAAAGAACRSGAAVARGAQSGQAVAELTRVPPAALSLQQPVWRQLVDGLVGAVGLPIRYFRLARITREVVGEAKKRLVAQRSQHGTGRKHSGGASKTLMELIPTYMMSHVVARTPPEVFREVMNTTLNAFMDSITAAEPYDFKPYHQAVRGPGLDHYTWGNDFFRPMLKYRSSRLEGLAHVAEIQRHLDAGENVVLFANHQTEADPQVISLLLELKGYETLAERCIFVAGHKVTTDRMAVPFSMGRNLLTIFSKKYLTSFSPEEREGKLGRNRETVGEMQRLLKEGGNLFWVAPSGGRDRRSPTTGAFEPAAFDEASVGLFLLLAQKAAKAGGTKTHFFPLAMWTHRLVPAPEGQAATVGEARSVARAPVGLQFGPELDPQAAGGRKRFPAAAEKAVRGLYGQLRKLMES